MKTKQNKIEEAIEFLENKGFYVFDDKPYCYWTKLDVKNSIKWQQKKGKYKGFVYTDKFGELVMGLISARFAEDSTYGITWDSIEKAIEDLMKYKNLEIIL
jgi:hypothetical protein